MRQNSRHITLAVQQSEAGGQFNLPGYPAYPASEDIFSKYKEEKNINPEDTSGAKETNEESDAERNAEVEEVEDMSGSSLDVPGSELDDEQERNGGEDEENNFYSLGGDSHEN
jgi:hypothetical protein